MKLEQQAESRSQKRARFIEYIYQFEVMGWDFSHIQAFESGNFSESELKMIESIEKNYPKFKALIQKFINKNWTLDRIAPLERAILIFGAFELSFSDKSKVIFELVSYAKGYIPGDSYKFINGVLDKIGEFYEQVKSNKASN